MKEELNLREQYKEKFRELARHFLFRNVPKNWRFIINRLIIGTIGLIVMLPKIGADFNPSDKLGILGTGAIIVDFCFTDYCGKKLGSKATDKGLAGFIANFYEDYLNIVLSGFIVFLPTMIYLTLWRSFGFIVATIFVMLIIEKKLDQRAILNQLRKTEDMPGE